MTIRLHCIYCRRTTTKTALRQDLCPDTYRCLSCGHVQKHENLDSDDRLSVDDAPSDEPQ